MNYKIFIQTICILFGLSKVWAQTEAIVNFDKSNIVLKTKGFRFSFYTSKDTLMVIHETENKNIKQNHVLIPPGNKTVSGLFEYSFDLKEWHKVEYPITLEKELKRIEVNLYFSANDKKEEFLQDFTVDKFYTTNRVSIQTAFTKQIGEQPVFRIISKCDTTFWGCSSSNHFYGTIKTKTPNGWHEFKGSYCASTVPQKPLHKNDTVYSWVPNYHPGDEYKFKQNGTYKYSVAMALERDSYGIPSRFAEQAQTRKRTRLIYELETEFIIE